MNIEERLRLSPTQRNYSPQNYVPSEGALSPPPDFIISRDTDGKPLSLYKHDVWRMGAYSTYNITYSFIGWHSDNTSPLYEAIQREMKTIQFSRLYLFPKARKVQSVAVHALRSLAAMALSNSITIKELITQQRHEAKILRAIAATPKHSTADLFVRLLRDINIISKTSQHSGLAILEGLSKRAEGILQSMFPETDRREQTWLIPSRIYAAIINEFAVNLDTFNSMSAKIIEFYRRRQDEPEYGYPLSNPPTGKKIDHWKAAMTCLGLSDDLLNLGITNLAKLNGYLNEVIAIAKFWIHIFSGMRDDEVSKLACNALQTIRINGQEIPVIMGNTYKGASENYTPTTWITSPAVKKAFDAAIAIGSIARIKNSYPQLEDSRCPLFPMLTHTKSVTQSFHFEVPIRASFKISVPLRKNPVFLVTESDIRELEMFDGFTDWRGIPGLVVGKPWPLKTHQCRRSLAVYAARSGMVSLGSMALQYKHLTEFMTSYYRHGSTFAINFVIDPEQKLLIDDIDTQIKLRQYELYEADVINSSSPLWGGEGNRIQVAENRGKPLIITTDRKFTKQKFERGEMVYKEGPAGGCTNPNPCALIKFTNLTPCVDCSHSILSAKSMPKINKAITIHRKALIHLPENSPFREQIISEISSITAAVNKAGYGELLED